MVGPKKQDFWPKLNIGNQCILRMILENKLVQKFKLEKKQKIVS
jgi:hypothetical protein